MIYFVAVLQLALLTAGVLYYRSQQKQQAAVLDTIRVSGQAVTSAVFRELRERTNELAGVISKTADQHRQLIVENAEELDEQLVQAFFGLSDAFSKLHEHVTGAHHAAGQDRVGIHETLHSIVRLIKPEDFPQGPRECPRQ